VTTGAASRFSCLRRLGLLALFGVVLAVVAVDHAAAKPGAQIPGRAADAGMPSATETGRPICVRVGTRSDGWAWPSGEFIHWAKCKGVVPKCRAATGDAVEGWYAHGALIVPAPCRKRAYNAEE
jgi:hypothetical protein